MSGDGGMEAVQKRTRPLNIAFDEKALPRAFCSAAFSERVALEIS